MKRAFLSSLLVLSLAVNCSNESTEPDGEDGGDKPKPTYVGAAGVTVTEVKIYQSLERTLMTGDAPGAANIPLVAGRDAVIRVFYTVDENYDGGEVLGRLTIDGFEDPIEATAVLGGGSTQEDVTSTMNFAVPGDHIGSTFSYSVELLQEGKKGTGNEYAQWPAEGFDTVTVEGAQNKLRVILVPFAYNYDDSGRVPDVSPEGIEKYRTKLKQLYPVSDVEVTAHEPIQWNQYIGPDGTGWQGVGQRVYQLRFQENVPDDVYLYGVFNPRASFAQYCGGGCLLGVTLLNDQPPSTGSVDLRLALGVGFEGYAHETCAHELGHSHGREHSPCGGAGQPDPDYPHVGGKIGLWGMDTATMELIPPTATDIMGYCTNVWVSDFTYTALFNRGKNVNQARWQPAVRRPAILVNVEGDGTASWGGYTELTEEARGTTVAGRLRRANGVEAEAEIQFFHWDHLPGGWAFVPTDATDVSDIELELDGRRLVVRAP